MVKNKEIKHKIKQIFISITNVDMTCENIAPVATRYTQKCCSFCGSDRENTTGQMNFLVIWYLYPK